MKPCIKCYGGKKRIDEIYTKAWKEHQANPDLSYAFIDGIVAAAVAVFGVQPSIIEEPQQKEIDRFCQRCHGGNDENSN